ncbi:MAG: hypothetical protein QG657_3229 [Acidobacteriota bacterium]|nr:hypothetical protein [Acidobacteriota bacterium]
MSRKLTRRAFIKSGGQAIAAWGAAAGSFSFLTRVLAGAPPVKSRVILAQNPKVINQRNECNQEEVTALFNKALLALTGAANSAHAWASLGLVNSDVVAVKVNCNNWTIDLRPHQELVRALCQSLNSVIALNQIIIYERSNSDLVDGGFTINKTGTGVRVFGNDDGAGYHPQEKLTRIITDTASKIINMASLKCVESDFGVSLFFKNHIGSLLDKDMSKCHGDPDFLAEVSARPSIKQKTILNLCDGLRGTYRRGVPWYWAGIIMGKDPVTSEYAAIQVINEKRKMDNVSLLQIPDHLRIAENKYKLGTWNPTKIEILKV